VTNDSFMGQMEFAFYSLCLSFAKTELEMKNILIILCWLPVLASSCLSLDYSLFPNTPRGEGRSSQQKRDSTQSHDYSEPALWISAVSLDSGYDWRRDSAYYSNPGKIILYRNFVQVLSIDLGIRFHTSQAADLHHLIQGHLYTEYCDGARTYIKKDGLDAFCIDNPERLVGLCENDSSIFTLGISLKNGGLYYRKQGKALLENLHATPIGDFNDLAYSEQGALYLDEGDVCFCYFSNEDGEKNWYGVRNEKLETIASGNRRVEDCRLCSGNSYVLVTDNVTAELIINGEDPVRIVNFYGWSNGSIRILDGKVTVMGNCVISKNSTTRTVWWEENNLSIISFGQEDHILNYGRETYFLDEAIQDEYFLMNNRCVLAGESALYYGIAPRKEGPPLIKYGTTLKTLDINGYITGISWY